MPVKVRNQAVEILLTLDQRLIRVVIVPDPDEDAKAVPLFQTPSSFLRVEAFVGNVAGHSRFRNSSGQEDNPNPVGSTSSVRF